MLNTKFGDTHNYFQKGALLSIKSVLGLHEHMRDKLNLPYLKTSKVTTDFQENFHYMMRSADGKGGNQRPTSNALNYRISR